MEWVIGITITLFVFLLMFFSAPNGILWKTAKAVTYLLMCFLYWAIVYAFVFALLNAK